MKNSTTNAVIVLDPVERLYKSAIDVEYNQIVTAISSRKSELAAVKAEQMKERKKAKELANINTSALPDHLKGLANSLVSENA